MKLTRILLLFFPFSAYSLESALQDFVFYEKIAFQNTMLDKLFSIYGSAELFSPRTEALVPDQVCYKDKSGLHVEFFVDRYGVSEKKEAAKIISGVSIKTEKAYEAGNKGINERPYECASSTSKLSPCIGGLCIGDTYSKAEKLLEKGHYYKFGYQWHFKTKLSIDDLAIKFCCAEKQTKVPDWIYPDHIVTVRTDENNKIISLYVVISLDMT